MRVTVVSQDRTLAQLLESVGVDVRRVLPEEITAGIPLGPVDLVVVDARSPGWQGVVSRTDSGTAVVVACQSSDVEVVREAVRAGASDVLFVDRPDDVVSVVHGASRRVHVSPARKRGQTVVLVSSQGGVGRSTLAVNLALALSSGGSVCLVDLVPSHGVLHVLCNVHPDRTVADAVAAGATPEAVSRCWVDWEGIRLLAAASGHEVWKPDEGSVERLLESCASLSDYVVIDSERVPERYTPVLVDRASLVVALCRMTVPGLRNMRGYLQDLGRMHVPLQKVVVVGVSGRWGISPQEAEEICGIQVGHVLPWDQTAVWAENQGVPVVLGAPRSALARSVWALAGVLLERLTAPVEAVV